MLFFSLIPLDEPIIVAIVVKDNQKNELLPDCIDEPTDGLESAPITFFRSQPPVACSKEFHAEAVMISDVDFGETFHLIDSRFPQASNSLNPVSSSSARRSRKLGKTYFARRLHEKVVVVVFFPKTIREKSDGIVQKFFGRLERLFII